MACFSSSLNNGWSLGRSLLANLCYLVRTWFKSFLIIFKASPQKLPSYFLFLKIEKNYQTKSYKRKESCSEKYILIFKTLITKQKARTYIRFILMPWPWYKSRLNQKYCEWKQSSSPQDKVHPKAISQHGSINIPLN